MYRKSKVMTLYGGKRVCVDINPWEDDNYSSWEEDHIEEVPPEEQGTADSGYDDRDQT